MKKIVKKSMIFFVILMFTIVNKSYAEGSFSISASQSSINQGESVTLTISGNNAYGKVNISVKNGVSSDTSVFLQNDTKTVTITSTSSEDIEIVVSPSSSGLGDIDENPITSSKSKTVKINKASSGSEQNPATSTTTGSQTQQPSAPTETTPTKSNNANLSNLGIRPNDFSGFKAATTQYSVSVPNNVEKIEIYAQKSDNKQTISGTGMKDLKEGANTFEITVTAEDGTTKTYTLNVERKVKEEKEEPEETTASEEPKEERPIEVFGLSELKIEKLELEPEFKTDIYEYKARLKEDIDELEISAIATEENAKIEITGNEELQDGENIITIVVKDKAGDKIATYQITVDKNLEDEEALLKEEQERVKQQKRKKVIILSVIAVTAIIATVVAIIIIIRRTRMQQYEFDDEGYEEEEDFPYPNLYTSEEGDFSEEYEIEEEFEEDINWRKQRRGKRFK